MSRIEGPLYCIVAGGILAYLSGQPLWLGYASQRWPWTVGKILDVSTSVEAIEPSADPPSPGHSGWTAEFLYKYNVHGSVYRGGRLRFTAFSFREAKRAAAHLQSGHGVRVSYNPRDPKLSVLVPGVTIWGIGAFAASALVTLAGLLWLAAALLS